MHLELFSPTPLLLSSNSTPSPLEIKRIHQAIEQAEKMALELRIRLSGESDVDCNLVGRLLESLDNGPITRLRNRKTSLKRQMKEALCFAHRHRAVISVVRRIPTDILLEIFSYLLPKMPCHDHPELISEFVAFWNKRIIDLWALSQVCRAWRSATLHMNEFWAYLPVIHIKNFNAQPSEIDGQLEVIREILRRSKEKPISLFVYVTDVYVVPGLNPVIALLLDCSDRWGAAILALSCSSLASNFSRISGHLGKLRSLSIIALDLHLPPGVEHNLLNLTLFKYAPWLRCIYFRGNCDFPFYMGLPVNQLCHVDTNSAIEKFTNMRHPLDSLTLCIATYLNFCLLIKESKLRRLHVIGFKSSLRKLSLENWRVFWMTMPLATIEELHIDSYEIKCVLPWAAGVVCAFPQLTALCIHTDTACSESTLIRILERTPALITLNISIPSFQTILAISHHNAAAPKLVPNLEVCNIFVEDIVYDWCGKSASLRILASLRCEKNPKIKHLGVHFPINGNDQGKPYLLLHPQSRLEGWKPDSETVKMLQKLALDLFDELPEINPSASHLSRTTLDSHGIRRVMKILYILDSMPIAHADYAHNIYASGIHFALRDIAEGKALSDNEHHFSDYAKPIFSKWQPVLEEAAKHRHWVLHGDMSLVYIPLDDALRMSSEARNSLVFGLPAISDWPAHILSSWPALLRR